MIRTDRCRERPADATAEAVLAAGVRTVGLLGTAFTMEQAFYRDRLAAHGLDVLIPAESERQVVHRVIYEELVHGVVSDSSREAYRRIISTRTDRGADGLFLGCTEIELLISPADAAVPVFPTTAIHVEAALRAAEETHPG